MKRFGNYDFLDLMNNHSERIIYSWVDREDAAEAQRGLRVENTTDSSRSAVLSLCEQVLRYYPMINQLGVSHEMRVRMLVDFVYRVVPWREQGVTNDDGISVYETLHAADPKKRLKADLAEAFLHYESNRGSVVCGGFAWLLSWTLQYFGYWAVVLDSKFKNSNQPDTVHEGVVVNGHHTVIARVCDDESRRCKWVHLDPSIGCVILAKQTQTMASFFDVIESFYHLQSDDGFEVVPAWTNGSSTAPEPRSLIPNSQVNCKVFWSLLDVCASNFNTKISIPGSGLSLVFAARTMKNMVSELVLPSTKASWWFFSYTDASKAAQLPSHDACFVAITAPPCCSSRSNLSAVHLAAINSDLMRNKISRVEGRPCQGKTKYLIKDAQLKYAKCAA
jgi:hypothetical protein